MLKKITNIILIQLLLAILGLFSLASVRPLALVSAAGIPTHSLVIESAEACPPNSPKCSDLYAKYITPGVKLLTIIMGTIIVLSIIIAGIQYSSAGSEPQKVAAARRRIGNSIFGLIAYLFLYAFLSYVIPGGIG